MFVRLFSSFTVFCNVIPKGVGGRVDLSAQIANFYALNSPKPTKAHSLPNGAKLSAELALNLVDYARASPTSLMLWNENSTRARLLLHGGSGHFWIDDAELARRISTAIHVAGSGGGQSKNAVPTAASAEVEITPLAEGALRLTIYDLCIEGSTIDVEVKVADINALRIEGPYQVPLEAATNFEVVVLDAEGKAFPLAGDYATKMQLALKADDDLTQVRGYI